MFIYCCMEAEFEYASETTRQWWTTRLWWKQKDHRDPECIWNSVWINTDKEMSKENTNAEYVPEISSTRSRASAKSQIHRCVRKKVRPNAMQGGI